MQQVLRHLGFLAELQTLVNLEDHAVDEEDPFSPKDVIDQKNDTHEHLQDRFTDLQNEPMCCEI